MVAGIPQSHERYYPAFDGTSRHSASAPFAVVQISQILYPLRAPISDIGRSIVLACKLTFVQLLTMTLRSAMAPEERRLNSDSALDPHEQPLTSAFKTTRVEHSLKFPNIQLVFPPFLCVNRGRRNGTNGYEIRRVS